MIHFLLTYEYDSIMVYVNHEGNCIMLNEHQHSAIVKIYGENYTVEKFYEIDSHTFYIIILVQGRDHYLNLSMGKYFDRDGYYIWSAMVGENVVDIV